VIRKTTSQKKNLKKFLLSVGAHHSLDILEPLG
jgi:hypothetical protein